MRVLISAGPTREYFDSVRFISNPSSGKMGFALARAAVERGHDCTLVSGPVQLDAPRGVHIIRVTTADEMLAACVSAFARADAAIMTAAVCDYRPQRRLSHKLRKQKRPRTITLVPTPDILTQLGAVKGRRIVIGFAMEDHHDHAHAESKLRRKHCDAIVLNGLRNVGADDATVEILVAGRPWSRPRSASKLATARNIIALTERLVAGAHAAGSSPRRPVRRRPAPRQPDQGR